MKPFMNKTTLLRRSGKKKSYKMIEELVMKFLSVVKYIYINMSLRSTRDYCGTRWDGLGRKRWYFSQYLLLHRLEKSFLVLISLDSERNFQVRDVNVISPWFIFQWKNRFSVFCVMTTEIEASSTFNSIAKKKIVLVTMKLAFFWRSLDGFLIELHGFSLSLECIQFPIDFVFILFTCSKNPLNWTSMEDLRNGCRHNTQTWFGWSKIWIENLGSFIVDCALGEIKRYKFNDFISDFRQVHRKIKYFATSTDVYATCSTSLKLRINLPLCRI